MIEQKRHDEALLQLQTIIRKANKQEFGLPEFLMIVLWFMCTSFSAWIVFN